MFLLSVYHFLCFVIFDFVLLHQSYLPSRTLLLLQIIEPVFKAIDVLINFISIMKLQVRPILRLIL